MGRVEQRARFEHLKIDFERYAVLDALREVIGMARSGDLEIELPPGTIRPVSDAEVVASHHRKDRYRAHPLLRPRLTEEPPPTPAVAAAGPSLAGKVKEDASEAEAPLANGEAAEEVGLAAFIPPAIARPPEVPAFIPPGAARARNGAARLPFA